MARQFLRDPLDMEFLVVELDIHIAAVVQQAKEDGTVESERPRVRRLRAIATQVKANAITKAEKDASRNGGALVDDFA